MTTPYKRAFQTGRQSDQFLNDELHQIVELVRHLNYMPETDSDEPTGKLEGSLWIDPNANEAKRYDSTLKIWKPIYQDQLKIITHITDDVQPENPALGQLWIQNGILMWFNGVRWQPIQTLLADGTQFSLAAFEDFILISPLSATDNFITTGHGESSQFIVPRYDIDRTFLNNTLYTDTIKISPISMEIKKRVLDNKRVSLVHVNSGKLTKIKKRLIQVDKKNSKIMIPASNTEYYGFQSGNPYGEFIYPHSENNKNDGYSIIAGGISLPYTLTQNYKYVLAVTYTFSWMRSTGGFYHTKANEAHHKNYIQDGKAPYTFFAEGYALSNEDYTLDPLSQTFEIYDDNVDELEILAMRTLKPEEGIITSQDLENICYVRPHSKYYSPLLFINGVALHTKLNDIAYDDEEFSIINAERGMEWRVIELWDEQHEYDMFEDAGIVTDQTELEEPIIYFNTIHIRPDDDIILFIDGILIRKEEIIRNDELGYVMVKGLRRHLEHPMDYILLKDRYQYLYPSNRICPALQLPYFDESLVYVDGKIVCSETAVRELKTQEDCIALDQPLHNEIKEFVNYSDESKHGLFMYNSIQKRWYRLNKLNQQECNTILKFYGNSYKAIKFNHNLKEELDRTDIYVYRYANSVEHCLEVYNVDVTDKKTIETPAIYQYGRNQLRVWCDGVRIYPDTPDYPGIIENTKGLSFDLPEKFTGRVTYIIERTETGLSNSATMEVLDYTNLKPDYVNVYTTKTTMYPGRTSVYLNGVRLSNKDYKIYDNHTLFILNDEALIGNPHNYPKETFIEGGNTYEINRKISDCILVEVRQDNRQERTITIKDRPAYELDVTSADLDIGILDAQDEILIFVDGLFVGTIQGEGYRKNVATGKLEIMDDTILEVINNDELIMKLDADNSAQIFYQQQNQASYERADQKITLEWR